MLRCHKYAALLTTGLGTLAGPCIAHIECRQLTKNRLYSKMQSYHVQNQVVKSLGCGTEEQVVGGSRLESYRRSYNLLASRRSVHCFVRKAQLYNTIRSCKAGVTVLWFKIGIENLFLLEKLCRYRHLFCNTPNLRLGNPDIPWFIILCDIGAQIRATELHIERIDPMNTIGH